MLPSPVYTLVLLVLLVVVLVVVWGRRLDCGTQRVVLHRLLLAPLEPRLPSGIGSARATRSARVPALAARLLQRVVVHHTAPRGREAFSCCCCCCC